MPPRAQVHEPDDEDIIANPAVLASADLLPHILSSFELNEGLRVAPVCTAWADVWRSMLQEQLALDQNCAPQARYFFS